MTCNICMEGPCECGMWRFPNGKYKGECIQDVYDEDPDYINHIVETYMDGETLERVMAYLEPRE